MDKLTALSVSPRIFFKPCGKHQKHGEQTRSAGWLSEVVGCGQMAQQVGCNLFLFKLLLKRSRLKVNTARRGRLNKLYLPAEQSHIMCKECISLLLFTCVSFDRNFTTASSYSLYLRSLLPFPGCSYLNLQWGTLFPPSVSEISYDNTVDTHMCHSSLSRACSSGISSTFPLVKNRRKPAKVRLLCAMQMCTLAVQMVNWLQQTQVFLTS